MLGGAALVESPKRCCIVSSWGRERGGGARQPASVHPGFSHLLPSFPTSISLYCLIIVNYFQLFYIHCHSRVCTTCLTSPALLLPSLPWTSTQLYDWTLNLRPFQCFGYKMTLICFADTAASPCFVGVTKPPSGYLRSGFLKHLTLLFLTGGVSLLVLGGRIIY